MKIIKYPKKEDWRDFMKRPIANELHLDDLVSSILKDVKENGDKAVRKK